MYKVLANAQVFQAIYINTDAEKKQEVIVFIEDLVESESQAEGILNSMLKEPYFGMVVSGTNVNVAKFRHNVYELDNSESLGSKDVKTILKTIVNESKKCKCMVEYVKAPHIYDESPDVMLEACGVELKDGQITAANISPIVVKRQHSIAIDMKKMFEGFSDFMFGTDYNKYRENIEDMNIEEFRKLKDYFDKNQEDVNDLRSELKKAKKGKELEKVLKDFDLIDADRGMSKMEELVGLRDFQNAKYYIVTDINDIPEVNKTDRKVGLIDTKFWELLKELGVPQPFVVHYLPKGAFLVASSKEIKLDEPWFPKEPTNLKIETIENMLQGKENK